MQSSCADGHYPSSKHHNTGSLSAILIRLSLSFGGSAVSKHASSKRWSMGVPIDRRRRLFSNKSASAPGARGWRALASAAPWTRLPAKAAREVSRSSERSSWIVGSGERIEKWPASVGSPETQPGPASERIGWKASRSTPCPTAQPACSDLKRCPKLRASLRSDSSQQTTRVVLRGFSASRRATSWSRSSQLGSCTTRIRGEAGAAHGQSRSPMTTRLIQRRVAVSAAEAVRPVAAVTRSTETVLLSRWAPRGEFGGLNRADRRPSVI